MKISHLIASGALLLTAQTSFANNDQANLRDELNAIFLQDKISRIKEQALSIRADLGESWIDENKQHELDVIKDGVDQLGNLMLGTYVIDNSPVLGTSLSAEITSGRQQYRILRDAHPKGHQCVSATFTVEDNDFFPADSFLGDQGQHQAVVRYSSASASPDSDATKDIRGSAVKVLLAEQNQEQEQSHDFLMITAPIIPTDTAEDFINLVKVARVANCIGIIEDEDSDSFFGAIRDFQQQVMAVGQCISDAGLSIFDVPKVVIALKRINDLNKDSAIESVFDKSFFGVSPYAFDDTVFKFEISPSQCDDANNEQTSLSAAETTSDKGLELNIKRVLSAGNACYDFNVVARPAFLTDKQAIETHSKTWDDMVYRTLERTKVATLMISQLSAASEISPLSCDEMKFTPANTAERFKPLGSLNRARTLVYEALSDFRLEANDYLRQR